MNTCSRCGIQYEGANCPSCVTADLPREAFAPPTAQLATDEPRKGHPTGNVGLALGLISNLIVIFGTSMALPQTLRNAQAAGGQIDESTAIGFFFGFCIVGVLGFGGLIFSIFGAMLGQKKAISIIGIVVSMLPPVTYIATCFLLGIYMRATGQF